MIDETVEYESAKQELDRISDHRADGCILRSKARWYEEGKRFKIFIAFRKKGIKSNRVSEG